MASLRDARLVATVTAAWSCNGAGAWHPALACPGRAQARLDRFYLSCDNATAMDPAYGGGTDRCGGQGSPRRGHRMLVIYSPECYFGNRSQNVGNCILIVFLCDMSRRTGNSPADFCGDVVLPVRLQTALRRSACSRFRSDPSQWDFTVKPLRVDLSKTGDISILTDIMDGIAHSEMFLADISSTGYDSKTAEPYRNGNVMYEVGLAVACLQAMKCCSFETTGTSSCSM